MFSRQQLAMPFVFISALAAPIALVVPGLAFDRSLQYIVR
jgi:hypothetical protein